MLIKSDSTFSPNNNCPCRSKKTYQHCCQPLHEGQPASTAERLMRSRYSAYVLGLTDYLQQSWHRSKRPSRVRLFADQWTGLKIIHTEKGQSNDKTGIVEFIAKYKMNGKAHRLQERSRFLQEDRHWFYIDGEYDE